MRERRGERGGRAGGGGAALACAGWPGGGAGRAGLPAYHRAPALRDGRVQVGEDREARLRTLQYPAGAADRLGGGVAAELHPRLVDLRVREGEVERWGEGGCVSEMEGGGVREEGGRVEAGMVFRLDGPTKARAGAKRRRGGRRGGDMRAPRRL